MGRENPSSSKDGPNGRPCLDDVCPMLWGKLFKEVLNTSIPLITLRNSKTVSAWKIHTIAVFPRHKDRKLLHNFHIIAGFPSVQGKTGLGRTYTSLKWSPSLPVGVRVRAFGRNIYACVRKRNKRESQGCCGFYRSRPRLQIISSPVFPRAPVNNKFTALLLFYLITYYLRMK